MVQNILLGLGGHQLLEALEVTPHLYHLNEGRTSFVALARLAAHKQQKPHATMEELTDAICQELVASKHTVLSASGMYIPEEELRDLLAKYCRDYQIDFEQLFDLAEDPIRKGEFTTTRFMLQMSQRTNAVSQLHAVYEKKFHPESDFDLLAITNGIYLPRWQRGNIASAEDKRELWSAHGQNRQELVDFVNDRCQAQLDPDVLTVVWARRIAPYKRPTEVFQNVQQLADILTNGEYPVQLIIAGRPDVSDDRAVQMANQIGEHALNPKFQGRIVYLRGYDLEIAHQLVRGADVWLNTPERGYEASGTSGMKAAANGVLQCSVSDGWIDEIDIKTIGWELPNVDTAHYFYSYLENNIAPMFYQRDEEGLPNEWLAKMNQAIRLIEEEYTTERMLKDYQRQLY